MGTARKKGGGGQSAAAVEELVRELAGPVVERHGAQLWAVEFATEPGGRYLRILLDREGEPVDLDLCEAISRELDGLLDDLDPIEESYYLEVGSAGLDRPLKRQSDFDRFAGELVEVSLYAPIEICGKKQKRFEATLVGLKDGELTLKGEDDIPFTLPLKSAASVKLAILFD
ncbi:MAG TPA: ribosome maturation factor RimP [Terriglobales bacterium]|nr:ribosome maturation factor RimP [Terriglobales bacterium]